MGAVRVDGTPFYWMGSSSSSVGVGVAQKDMKVRVSQPIWVTLPAKLTLNPPKFTSTKTIITVTCGGVDVTATFLSPIEVCPSNL